MMFINYYLLFAKKNVKYFILLLILTLGTYVRLLGISLHNFPLNDGGMFYSMINDIKINNYSLPIYTSYNHYFNIPFSYPPLSFYLYGLLQDITKIDLIKIIQWLPGLITCIHLPVFYIFSKKYWNDDFLALSSTYIFSMSPSSFEWLRMGGGVSRSLGYLFWICLLISLVDFEKNNSNKRVLISGICFGLAALSHPEIGLVGLITIFVLIFSKIKFTLAINKILFIFLSSLLILIPWITAIIVNGNILAIINGFLSSGVSLILYLSYISGYALSLSLSPSLPPYLNIVGVLCLLGIIYTFFNKKYYLTIWVTLIVLFVPRAAINYTAVPVSIISVYSIFIFLNQNTELQKNVIYIKNLPKLFIVLTIVIFYYLLIVAISVSYISTAKNVINHDDLMAFYWVRSNTDDNNIFLVVPSLLESDGWANDYVVEWFPAISNRSNITTVQGQEWKGQLFDSWVLYLKAKRCGKENPDCWLDLIDQLPERVDYLYVSSRENREYYVQLNYLLKSCDFFSIVYDKGNVSIYKILR